jgi:hypothetical protein
MKTGRSMKTATGLTLLAGGAILAFAVRASPPGLNLNIAGWVIMLTGVAGLVAPRRASGWLRRRVLVRRKAGRPAASQIDDMPYPHYVLRDPAALASAILRDAELAGDPADDPPTVAGPAAGIRVDGWADPAPVPLDELLDGRAGPGRRAR